MGPELARQLIQLHDNADRALANLRNAGAMSTDDPRAPELLSEAGDAYAVSLCALTEAQDAIIDPPIPGEDEGGLLDAEDRAREAAAGVALPEGFEDGKAVWIAKDGTGAGFVQAGVEGIAEGNVAVRLTTDATFRSENFPDGATVSIPADCLSMDASAVPGAGETPVEGSGEGESSPAA